MTENRTIRVATVDDHPIFRHGIRHLLETEEDLLPVAELGSLEEALDWLPDNPVDVLLLDHNLPGIPGIDGLPLLLRLRQDLQVIVLTVCDRDEELIRAIRHGACGYVLKDAPPERLLEAIRAAARGESRVSPQMINSLFRRIGRQADPAPAPGDLHRCQEEITPRERALLRCLCDGASNKEIGLELGISPNTVRNQLQRLQERFGARNRVHLAMLVRDAGHLERGAPQGQLHHQPAPS